MLRCSVLAAFALLAGLLAACGGPSPDLAPVRDTLPVYPGAGVYRENAAPQAVRTGSPSLFQYDRIYVTSGSPTQDVILTAMTEALIRAGWQQEQSTTSRAKEMRDYCELVWVTCGSFIKDDVRVVVSVPLALNLNPLAGAGASYHTHLERQ